MPMEKRKAGQKAATPSPVRQNPERTEGETTPPYAACFLTMYSRIFLFAGYFLTLRQQFRTKHATWFTGNTSCFTRAADSAMRHVGIFFVLCRVLGDGAELGGRAFCVSDRTPPVG